MQHDVIINAIYPPDEAGMDPTKPPDRAGAVDEQQLSREAMSK